MTKLSVGQTEKSGLDSHYCGVAGGSGAVRSAKFFELENFRVLVIRGSEKCGVPTAINSPEGIR